MPRHPPCALHSLSHKHSTKTTKTRHHTTHRDLKPEEHSWRQKVATPGEELPQMLASTIQFTKTTPTQAITPNGDPVLEGPEEQDPVPGVPDSSKLNSVSNPRSFAATPRFHTHTPQPELGDRD